MGVTKTDFMRGMQCPRMLWLDKHHPELKVIPPEVQARLDAGNEFGDKAMGMFGPFVETTTYKADGKLDYNAMLQKTKECIEEKVPVICEAALMFYGNYCALDILRKNGAGWDIYEVKNSSSVEEQFIKDISFQKYIAYKVANKLVYKTIYNNVYQYADGIHYPTEFVRNEFERNVKRATPAFIVSNGVHNYVRKKETPKPIEFRDKIVILTTGRYAREKSQDTLLKAVRYSAYKDRIQLILAGQGTKEKYYKKLAKKLPVAPVFQLFSREEMVDVINYSDMYVHPAEIELEGIACLEAITCGKLTIVSDSELSATKGFAVDERCVFKNRKPKDLAKVIDFWISHPTEKEACENKLLAYSSRFNQERCMDEMNQFFSSVYEKTKTDKEVNA